MVIGYTDFLYYTSPLLDLTVTKVPQHEVWKIPNLVYCMYVKFWFVRGRPLDWSVNSYLEFIVKILLPNNPKKGISMDVQ